jgi:hypothetical protein
VLDQRAGTGGAVFDFHVGEGGDGFVLEQRSSTVIRELYQLVLRAVPKSWCPGLGERNLILLCIQLLMLGIAKTLEQDNL